MKILNTETLKMADKSSLKESSNESIKKNYLNYIYSGAMIKIMVNNTWAGESCPQRSQNIQSWSAKKG